MVSYLCTSSEGRFKGWIKLVIARADVRVQLLQLKTTLFCLAVRKLLVKQFG